MVHGFRSFGLLFSFPAGRSGFSVILQLYPSELCHIFFALFSVLSGACIFFTVNGLSRPPHSQVTEYGMWLKDW